MYNLISRYMSNLSKEEVNDFAIKKNVNLSNEELDFVYIFVKKNWEQVIKNPKLLNLERYQDRFTPENFIKIKKLFIEYSSKYQAFLK
ncbi:MAG: hypothetical protein E7163_05560 [Firmicutes bacterium]|nr:hypothetical protein [Bacillota bacterium]